VAEPRATIPPPHATLPEPLPNCDGGAHGFISTRTVLRRRNHSPAWLPPRPRSGMQAASDNARSGWWVAPHRECCHYPLLRVIGKRSAVGYREKSRPLACKARWRPPDSLPCGVCCRNAAERAGLRDIDRREPRRASAEAGACGACGTSLPRHREPAPQRPMDLREAFRGFSRRSRTQVSAGWISFADTADRSPNLIGADASVFCFRGEGVGGDVHPGNASRHLSGLRSLPSGERGWDFQGEVEMTRERGRRFCLCPKPRGTIHGTRGHLFGKARTSFRGAGMSVSRDSIPSPQSGAGKTSFGDLPDILGTGRGIDFPPSHGMRGRFSRQRGEIFKPPVDNTNLSR
jgi:hypothetical protein